MQIAQNLYEGVDLKRDGGPVGLITYIRTDSTRVSEDAIAEVREHIEKRYGKAFVPEKPNYFRSKKNTQDAHEAIRPASMDLPPEAVRKHLKDEQYKLYKMIWNRFVASQMNPAVYDRTTPTSRPCGERRLQRVVYGLRATGRIQKFAGWLQVTEGQQSFAGRGRGRGHGRRRGRRGSARSRGAAEGEAARRRRARPCSPISTRASAAPCSARRAW
jgi:DNA topoisomerase-1